MRKEESSSKGENFGHLFHHTIHLEECDCLIQCRITHDWLPFEKKTLTEVSSNIWINFTERQFITSQPDFDCDVTGKVYRFFSYNRQFEKSFWQASSLTKYSPVGSLSQIFMMNSVNLCLLSHSVVRYTKLPVMKKVYNE